MNRPNNLCEVLFLPDGTRVSVPAGTSLLAAARKAGTTIPTRCSGKMGCLMCKVTLAPEDAEGVSAASDAERRKLGGLAGDGIRLACQAAVRAGSVKVTVPEDPLKAAVRRRLEEVRRQKEDELW